jgi:hypothetical protein
MACTKNALFQNWKDRTFFTKSNSVCPSSTVVEHSTHNTKIEGLNPGERHMQETKFDFYIKVWPTKVGLKVKI